MNKRLILIMNKDGKGEITRGLFKEDREKSNCIDKDGKEIFEGDIVENEAFRDFVVLRKKIFTTNSCNQPLNTHKKLKVIGNIFDDTKMFKKLQSIENKQK